MQPHVQPTKLLMRLQSLLPRLLTRKVEPLFWPGNNLVGPGNFLSHQGMPMTHPSSTESKTAESDSLINRFQKQLNKVEQLMNASMRPLIRQDILLSEEGTRQALITLERWSELYRHGLKASGQIVERGEKWLEEAYDRLSLTADELRKLDSTNEKVATQKETEKAKYFLETIEQITRLIIPLADEVKAPLVVSEAAKTVVLLD